MIITEDVLDGVSRLALALADRLALAGHADAIEPLMAAHIDEVYEACDVPELMVWLLGFCEDMRAVEKAPGTEARTG